MYNNNNKTLKKLQAYRKFKKFLMIFFLLKKSIATVELPIIDDLLINQQTFKTGGVEN